MSHVLAVAVKFPFVVSPHDRQGKIAPTVAIDSQVTKHLVCGLLYRGRRRVELELYISDTECAQVGETVGSQELSAVDSTILGRCASCFVRGVNRVDSPTSFAFTQKTQVAPSIQQRIDISLNDSLVGAGAFRDTSHDVPSPETRVESVPDDGSDTIKKNQTACDLVEKQGFLSDRSVKNSWISMHLWESPEADVTTSTDCAVLLCYILKIQHSVECQATNRPQLV